MGVVAQTKHVCGWPTCPLWGSWNVCPSAVQAEKKGQGERSPGQAPLTGRPGVKDEQKPSRGLRSATAASRAQGGAASSPRQSAPGRKEDAEHPAVTGCAVPSGRLLLGRGWPSHTTVTLWREKQARKMLCLLVTNSNSLPLQPWQLQGCRSFWRSPSLPWCSVPALLLQGGCVIPG